MQLDLPARFSRFTITFISAALLAMLANGCGDDSSGSNTDGTTDLFRDAGRDLGGGADSSGAPDGEPEPDLVQGSDIAADADDEEVPTTEISCVDGEDNDGDELVDCDDVDDCVCEICNDLLDNDGDELVDCADPNCSDDENCPERCQNEIDDDADGDADCDDSECAPTGRCSDGAMPAETYEFEQMGYFNRLQYPPDGVPCCFDYDDNPAPDNQLLEILELLPDYDAQANMDGVVNNGDVAVLIEWREFPEDFSAGGNVDFNIFRGVPIEPVSTGPETNAWEDGDGVFRVTADSFDDLGPRVRFENNLLGTDGVLTGGPHFLDLTIPIAELDLSLTLTVFQARVEMILEESDADSSVVETVPQITTGTEGTVTVGGGKLGGYVEADDLLAFFNDGAEQCGCAAPVTSPGPLLTYGEQGAPVSAYTASCNWTPLQQGDVGFTCTVADSALCPVLGQICGLISFLPLALDVDANKNHINEAVSVGLFFDVTGASLDDEPIEP